MQELEKIILSFCQTNGLEVSRVFDDLLRYIIQGFTIPGFPGLKDWKYTKAQNEVFMEMFCALIKNLKKEIDRRGWYDPFGEIYENIIASKSRRSNSGQFFTPVDICDLMTSISTSEPVSGQIISDCAAGSGRTLLSFNAKNLGNRYVAEDLDHTCAMMCVCNFLFHGMEGEVIWHDSLIPEKFFGAWKINDGINNPFSKYCGIPHIIPIQWEETTIKRMYDKREKDIRIIKHLKAIAEKRLAEYKKLRSKNTLTEVERAESKKKLKQYTNIIKLMNKYDKKR